MPRIRIGLIGLSKGAAVSWASVAHLPYLFSPQGRSRYVITALCNSSVDSARNAVEAFGLPADTKTYGNTAELATDPDIDLVVCNVRVDRHADIIKPSLQAGKAVFCEWPLASNMTQIRELVDLSRVHGAKTMIGLQGRVSPVASKLKKLLEQGKIGKILSSEVKASGGTNDRLMMSTFMDYFTDLKVGGNMVTIGVGHLLDTVQHVVGDFHNIRSMLQIQRPTVPIQDRHTKEIVDTVQSDVPDLIIATGSLKASPIAQEGATLHFRLRRGQPFPGEDPLVWHINGEIGELRLSSPGGAALNATAYNMPVTVELHDHRSDTVSRFEWEWEDWQDGLPIVARNTGMLYHNYASGLQYPTFEDALRMHEKLEEIMEGGMRESTSL